MTVEDHAARPAGSRRDAQALREPLRRWLAAKLPAGADPVVSEIDAPSSTGMSSETLLFSATWRDGDATRTEPLVARVAPDPGAMPVFPVYDMDKQARTIRTVGELGAAPVPEVLWSQDGSEPLGAPFFVMRRVEGQVPPDLMPYTFGSWLSEAPREDQARLQESSVEVLARLHAIGEPESRFDFLAPSSAGDSMLRRHVADTRAYYEWVCADGLRSPLLEACFARLDDSWPAREGPTVLSWGDARIGNVMFRDFTPVAVLDWEMASLGPPELDVGWFVFFHRFFQDVGEKYGIEGMPHFLRRDDVAASYEKASGYAPRDLDWFITYAALRHGIIMSRIQRRAIHFGLAEAPEDVDDLILHRGMIERLLSRTYW